MALTHLSEQPEYDRYGNLTTQRILGPQTDEQIKEDKLSLYNLTSAYLKKLPTAGKQEQITALMKIKQLIENGENLEAVPTLAMIHKAIEMKQLLKKADAKIVAKYKEPYFMNLNTGVFSYFDVDKLDYAQTRQVLKLPTNNVMYFPAELSSQDGLYNITTINLPSPETDLVGNAYVDLNKYLVVWQMVGFIEYPEVKPCVKQFDARVLMIGSGKMALSRVQHKMKWQKDDTNDGFNDQVVLMHKSIKNLVFDPMHDSGYMPYVPQKGVYSEWEVKNKPTYGQDNISNTSVFLRGNSRGIKKYVTDNNGEGILYFADKFNVINSHKFLSSTHDQSALGSLRKFEFIFNRVAIERQIQSAEWEGNWIDQYNDVAASDNLYKEITYFGPNFNPRFEAVQVIQPLDIDQSTSTFTSTAGRHPSHGTNSIFSRFAHDSAIEDSRNVAHEHELAGTLPSAPSQSDQAYMPDDIADGVHDSSIFLKPRGATFSEFLSMHGIQQQDTMFASAGVPFNTMSDTMKFSDVFDSITYQVKTTLMNANRAEKMYARFERTTEPMDIQDQFHFVYNSRFGPFIRSKLWQMSSHFSYAKSALTYLGDAVNTENALKATMGTQELKAFKERGDYFIFMYSSVFNGDTYDLIIKSIGHFIRYFSY